MSVTGTWKLTMNTPFGVQTPQLDITQNGNGFGGTLSGKSEPSPLEDISVDGAQIRFKTKVATPMGNFPVSFDATVDGDSMTGTYNTALGDTEFVGERATPNV